MVSSLRFENNKALFNATYFKQQIQSPLNLKEPIVSQSYIYQTYIQNPAEVELYLRSRLLDSINGTLIDTLELQYLYTTLLKTRPSWPYYYSGIAQVQQLTKNLNSKYISDAIKYGAHEQKVIKSLAEILFYNWNNFTKNSRLEVLQYLANQPDNIIAGIVTISAKFAKIYQYCDFLYEEKHVEYPACKQQYWQPLSY
ncbi:hypothetical protein MNBD_GAMMA03-1254 [hydrothermal vent metagenome]|uniref:Uncharacterized protein n=1 Tax=hydrothermal vent metagenome TaxID=652676 RepID=A0A3B0W298_9ZZZZ